MSILKKLRFKPSVPVHLLGDPTGAASIAPEDGYHLLKNLPARGKESVQQVLLFARDAASMHQEFGALAPLLADGAILWIAYPKKSGSIKSDLTRDRGWKVVDEWGFVGVSQVSLDGDWSALWFKKPEALRSYKRGTPMAERVAEGIDYNARMVSLPADATEALEAMPGLKDFFYSLSFSHKREWAEAISDAKKPETRARRIAKMVDDLAKQMTGKTTAKQTA